MPIFVLKDNEQFGPFELDELTQHVWEGTFLLTDCCWQDGWEEWLPIQSIVGQRAPTVVPLPLPHQRIAATPTSRSRVSPEKVAVLGGAAMVVLGISVVAVLLLGYFASPFWSLYRLKAAVERNDAVYVTDRVDFPQLRESLKGTLMAEMAKETMNSEAEGFEAMGAAFGALLIGPMVDAFVTPEGVMAMMQGREMDFTQEVDQEKPDAAVETPGAGETQGAMDISSMGYETLNRFTVTLAGDSVATSEETSGTLIFSRRGLIGWRLSGVRISPNY